MKFNLVAEYKPMGDQPEAIEQIVQSVTAAERSSTTLLGVTGSGKTFTIANVIAKLNRPTLIISHNKTLAAQLYGEFKNFFPDNAVEYFVSYYDYYQPEAYIPSTDTYIEKDLAINDEIERMRLQCVATLLSGRRDVIVVASVSCIYGCGNPKDFHESAITLSTGELISRQRLLRNLVDALYKRVESNLEPATFRVVGETIDIMASFGEFGSHCFRVMLDDKRIEAIYSIDPTSGQRLGSLDTITIYPCNIFVRTRDTINNALMNIEGDLIKQHEYFLSQGREMEAQRIKQRVNFDLEMIKELGYCSGIENYSRYFDMREAGTRPFCLLDFLPKDMLMVVDESHVTIPQVRAMQQGDHARKKSLVDYGFRLPAAYDNRPLTIEEYEELTPQTIYVSATPSNYEIERSYGVIIEQLIRPTYIIDPALNLKRSENQIDDIVDNINATIKRNGKVIITTITKRSSEEVSRYLDRVGIKNRYLHSDIETMERVQILDDLRSGLIDVIVGVNLLREGIDLPEVALVIIVDADKEGFLRNVRSITQITGRAARHVNGKTLLYGDRMNNSLRTAIIESNRRRSKQVNFNYDNDCIPHTAKKSGAGPNTLLSERAKEAEQGAVEVEQELRRSIEKREQSKRRKGGQNTTQSTPKSIYSVAEEMSSYTTESGTRGANMEAKGADYRANSYAGVDTEGDIMTLLQSGSAGDRSAIIESIDRLIEETKEDMNSAAKRLDFKLAAKHRDKMYELQKLRKKL